MVKAYLKQIHPVLPVKQVSRAINYYVNQLNFKLVFKDAGEDPRYAGVVRDQIEIHLQWHDEKEWEIEIDRPLLRIYVDEIDALFEEFKTQSVFHKHTVLKTTNWGTREFGIYDIDNNGLIFYKDVR